MNDFEKDYNRFSEEAVNILESSPEKRSEFRRKWESHFSKNGLDFTDIWEIMDEFGLNDNVDYL